MKMEGLPNRKQAPAALWNLLGIWAITSKCHQSNFLSPTGGDAGVCLPQITHWVIKTKYLL